MPLISPAAALGGVDQVGRFFRDLRKLYASSCGRVVGPSEFGAALGAALQQAPFCAEEITDFDGGRYVTPTVLYGALLLVREELRR